MASNGTDTPALLPGQSPPLSVLTPTDQTGVIYIATALGLVFALISLLIRYFIRVDLQNKVSADDILASLALTFAVAQSGTVFVEASKGFGKTIELVLPEDLLSLQKASYASDILYLITIWLTKCSVAFLLLRLSPNRGHNVASIVVLVTSTVFMIVSVFVVALKCDLAHPWMFINEKCTDLLIRWDVLSALDITTEGLLFLTSLYLVRGLQLPFSKKTIVVAAFGFRLPIILPIVWRLHFLRSFLSSSNPTLDGTLVVVNTQIEMNYAIIAATIPCLRPFMTALSTNYGAPAPKTPASNYGSNEYSLNSLSGRSKPASRKVASKKRKSFIQLDSREEASEKDIELGGKVVGGSGSGGGKGNGKRGNGEGTDRWRWDENEHTARIARGDGHSMESHESKQMIIERNTEWTVEFQGREESRPYQSHAI